MGRPTCPPADLALTQLLGEGVFRAKPCRLPPRSVSARSLFTQCLKADGPQAQPGLLAPSRFDPSASLDFLWACIHIPRIWQGRDQRTPQAGVGAPACRVGTRGHGRGPSRPGLTGGPVAEAAGGAGAAGAGSRAHRPGGADPGGGGGQGPGRGRHRLRPAAGPAAPAAQLLPRRRRGRRGGDSTPDELHPAVGQQVRSLRAGWRPPRPLAGGPEAAPQVRQGLGSRRQEGRPGPPGPVRLCRCHPDSPGPGPPPWPPQLPHPSLPVCGASAAETCLCSCTCSGRSSGGPPPRSCCTARAPPPAASAR